MRRLLFNTLPWPMLLALLTACSWVAMTPPAGRQPHVVRSEQPVCTDSYVAPVVDTVVSAGAVAVSAVLVGLAIGCGNDSTEGCSTIGVGVVYPISAVLFAVSAVHGYRLAASCRSVRASWPGDEAMSPRP